MAKLITEMVRNDKPERADYDNDADFNIDLAHHHGSELSYHKSMHDSLEKSQGWNTSANIYNRDWKKQLSTHKKMIKFHTAERKKLGYGDAIQDPKYF